MSQNIRIKTAEQILNEINIGINIGNSLDSCPTDGRNDGSKPASYYETYWHNPIITEDLIKTQLSEHTTEKGIDHLLCAAFIPPVSRIKLH